MTVDKARDLHAKAWAQAHAAGTPNDVLTAQRQGYETAIATMRQPSERLIALTMTPDAGLEWAASRLYADLKVTET